MEYIVLSVFKRTEKESNGKTYYIVNALVRFDSQNLASFTDIIDIPVFSLYEAKQIKEGYKGFK